MPQHFETDDALLDHAALRYGTLAEQLPSYIPAPDDAFAEVMEVATQRLDDRDFITFVMYYDHRLPQARIAQLLGISQPSVWERLHQSIRSVRFWMSAPPIPTLAETHAVLDRHIRPELVSMAWWWCEGYGGAEIARWQGVPQGTVKDRLWRVWDALDIIAVCDDEEAASTARALIERARARRRQWTHHCPRWRSPVVAVQAIGDVGKECADRRVERERQGDQRPHPGLSVSRHHVDESLL